MFILYIIFFCGLYLVLYSIIFIIHKKFFCTIISIAINYLHELLNLNIIQVSIQYD